MIEIVTGKTWSVHCKRQTAEGTPVPFDPGQTIRAALRETPSGPKLVDVTAEIETGTAEFNLALTDEETAVLPVPRQFGAVRFLWLDADIIEGDEVLAMIVNERIGCRAGVTQTEVEP